MAVTHTASSASWYITPNGSGADDSVQIQGVLDAAAGAPARIQFGPGTFYVKTQLNGKNPAQWKFLGAGPSQDPYSGVAQLSKIVFGTSAGVAMDLVTSDPIRLVTNIHGYPCGLFFYEENASTVGQHVEIENLAFEVVSEEVAIDTPDQPIYWGIPWYNRGVDAVIHMSGKLQTHYPILYGSGEKAAVGNGSLIVRNCSIKSHLTTFGVPENFGGPESNMGFSIRMRDQASHWLGGAAYVGPDSTYGAYHCPGVATKYFEYPTDVYGTPIVGDLVISNCKFEGGTLNAGYHLWTHPGVTSNAFYTFDPAPSNVGTGQFLTTKNLFQDGIELMAGGLALTFCNEVTNYVFADNKSVGTVVGRDGGGGACWIRDIRAIAGNRTNYSYDVSSQPLGTFTIQDCDLTLMGDGENGAYISDRDGQIASVNVLRTKFRGTGFDGNGVGLDTVNNGLVTDCEFEQTQATAVTLTSCTNTQVRHNRYRGVLG